MMVREILIDDAGWGDLLLGVVIGALKLPEQAYTERRIPVSSFQSPRFENKHYLNDAVEVIREIIQETKADRQTEFKVCSGYVLSSIREYLRNHGFKVEKITVTGTLQEKVEQGYVKWCGEVGVPLEKLSGETHRFFSLLEWVKENPTARERFVKTGWKKWKYKWRNTLFPNTTSRIDEHSSLTSEAPKPQTESSRAYDFWGTEETEKLLEQYKKGTSIAELARKHQRTRGAIRSRLRKLRKLGQLRRRDVGEPAFQSPVGDEFVQARNQTYVDAVKEYLQEYCDQTGVFDNSSGKSLTCDPFIMESIVKNLKGLLKSIRFEYPEETAVNLKKVTQLSLREWEAYARQPYETKAHDLIRLTLVVALRRAIPFFESLIADRQMAMSQKPEGPTPPALSMIEKQRTELETRLHKLLVASKKLGGEELESKLEHLRRKWGEHAIHKGEGLDTSTIQSLLDTFSICWALLRFEGDDVSLQRVVVDKIAEIGMKLGFKSVHGYGIDYHEGRKGLVDVVWLSTNREIIAAFEIRTRRSSHTMLRFTHRDRQKLESIDALKKFLINVSRNTGKSLVKAL